ncbi:hypothetical protein GCM10018772_61560 [Streptomyces fumanus]|uniref:Uncharacterized protein n=1 Tax=Streptomyces fumanus TaxID=67302 RepID=A0A919AUR7_9ACTN|nr:hypothetical protein GCM10018772_61560 [Streptomyces fumanus]
MSQKALPGKGEGGGAAAGQPADLFTGAAVGVGDGVLEADVVGDGLGHDPGPADLHAAADR